MATNLNEFLSSHRPKRFEPIPHYVASGDFLTYYLRNERCFAKRIDDVLTIYHSIDAPERFAGCQINGVRKILERANSFGVHLNAGKVNLGFLFLVGMSMAKDEEQRRYYYELKDMVKDVSIDELHLI